jgi:hypothetical protein
MADVYVNGREISCKKGAGKVIASFPDVCLSPPSPPAGPLPVPYPLFAFAKDATSGSKNVKVNGQEVMQRDKSCLKSCKGDEAATKSLGQGVITHTLGGKVYFASWSMDVVIEGENAVRHLDMTTANHASPLGNESAPWPEVAKMAFAPGGKCEGVDEKLKLQKYSTECPPDKKGNKQTGHHLIAGRCMRGPNTPGYSHSRAPVICVSFGNQHQGSHKLCHNVFDPYELDHHEKGKPFHYEKARNKAAQSAGGAVDPPRDLTKKELDCIKFQLDLYYKEDPPEGAGCNNKTELKTSGAPGKAIPDSTMDLW